VVLLQDQVPPASRADIERAVDLCPVRAIQLVEDEA
jgi:ferredoxin